MCDRIGYIQREWSQKCGLRNANQSKNQTKQLKRSNIQYPVVLYDWGKENRCDNNDLLTDTKTSVLVEHQRVVNGDKIFITDRVNHDELFIAVIIYGALGLTPVAKIQDC